MPRKWNDWVRTPFQLYTEEHIDMTARNTARVIESLLVNDQKNLKKVSKWNEGPTIAWLAANTFLSEGLEGKCRDSKYFIDKVIGKTPQTIQVVQPTHVNLDTVGFVEFCDNAGYPLPYPVQVEMMKFGMFETITRMILGARNYGKTDYIIILGYAYILYLDWKNATKTNTLPTESCLLVTKSDERNAAILSEIYRAATANGVPFSEQSSTRIRVEGLPGKDASMSAITLGSSSKRGRHPKRVIMDDPVTEEDANSEAQRKKAERVYNELMKLTQNVLIIGQPVHKFDLYEKLRPLIKTMLVPHGTIPELDHDLEAQKLAGVSEESISASYHLKVISESGNPLEYVNFIDKFPRQDGTSVAFIDPSFEGGDYTAMSVIKSYFDGVAVFGKVWKRPWFNCIDAIDTVVKDFKVAKLCFETNSLGDQPVDLLRDFLPAGVGIVGRKSTNNKHARISAAGPFAKSIFISKESDREYIDQTTKYEYGAKNDDAPDSLATGLEWIGLIRGKIK